MYNPFETAVEADEDEQAALERIRRGDRDALERLVRRHQPWIYNIALRMVWDPHDAEDVTQEVLVKVITGLGGFSGASRLRTWIYRIVVNHVLNMRRRPAEPATMNFGAFAESLDRAPDADLAAAGYPAAEIPLLVEEAKVSCMTGMLLCLDRRQRLVFTLGEILGVADRAGAELLDVTPDHFRQLLARARRDLYSFMNRKCGLVNQKNPCRCAKKTRAFIEAGYVDATTRRFVPGRVRKVEEVAPSRSSELEDLLERRHAELYRGNPFPTPSDETAFLRRLFDAPEMRRLFDPDCHAP